MCLTYSNVTASGIGETIQKNKGKRWSISLKLRDKMTIAQAI